MMKKYLFLILIVSSLLIFGSCDKKNEECDHESMKEATKSATCTESGYKAYICNDCGYSYIDEHIDAKGHAYEKKTFSPTCTKAGYTEYTCSCGSVYLSDYTDALGHTFNSEIKQPSCSENGYTKYTCSVCKNTYVTQYTSETGHSLKKEVTAPTCTAEGFSTYTCDCGYSFNSDYIKPNSHTYTEETLSSATCTQSGVLKYSCECGESYTVTEAPSGHNFDTAITMPTLSDMGFTSYTCTKCKFEYQGDFRFYSDILKNAYAESTAMYEKGIDVSYHNYKTDADGNYVSLDWEAIKASGISYVIIRAGDAAIGIDPTFEKSYTEAKAAGLDVGAYFYTRATNVHEITLEANLVLSALRDKQFEYPIYLDLEDESLMSIDPSILNEMCVTFFTVLQRSGYYTGLYVNDDWLYNLIDKETALSRFEIWYARYPQYENGEIPSWNEEIFGKALGMWQYTDSGIIDGIEHTVFDFNYCYKDYPSIIKQYGFNGYESNFTFPDTEKKFVWIIYPNPINVRSKSDYFTSNDYDPSLDIIGYAQYGTRFEVFEITESYTAIIYNGEIAYISAKPEYVSFTGLHS